MASPLDFTPDFQELWTAHPRDSVFGSRTDAFSNTDRCILHLPPYVWRKRMLKVVRHATTSALNNHYYPAALLRNSTEDSTNAFYKTCADNNGVY